MQEIFLSASVPIEGRGDYFKTSNPFLIQTAVRELISAVIEHRTIVWGGHPAITPMVWQICQDLGKGLAERVVLYQSMFFDGQFPEENAWFPNVIYTEKVGEDLQQSIALMRRKMLGRVDLSAAVFIGGMEGITDEFHRFREFHPLALVLPVAAPGGAARGLAQTFAGRNGGRLDTLNFARLFREELLTADERVAPPRDPEEPKR